MACYRGKVVVDRTDAAKYVSTFVNVLCGQRNVLLISITSTPWLFPAGVHPSDTGIATGFALAAYLAASFLNLRS